MDWFTSAAIALMLTLPITVAIAVGLLFALFARAGVLAPLSATATLRMAADGTLVEVDDDVEHILAA